MHSRPYDKAETIPIFDQMFLGLNLNPGLTGCDLSNKAAVCGPVNGTTNTGSQHLRLEFHLQNGSGQRGLFDSCQPY